MMMMLAVKYSGSAGFGVHPKRTAASNSRLYQQRVITVLHGDVSRTHGTGVSDDTSQHITGVN